MEKTIGGSDRTQPTKYVNVRSQFAPRIPAVSSSS